MGRYECRHGLSHAQITSAYQGVRAETLYFVPPGETLEVWRLRLERSRPPGRLSFSSVESCLWDAQDDVTSFQRNYSTGEVEVADGVIYHKTEYRERCDNFTYFACSEPLAGFDTQRDAFLGPYRGWDRPLAVQNGIATRALDSVREPPSGDQPDLISHFRPPRHWRGPRRLFTLQCSAH